MSDLRKAAEMALEALEEYTCVVQSGTDPNKWHEVVDGGKPAREAIQALRQALAQPEQEPEWVATIGNWGKVQWREDVFPHLGAKLYSAPPKREWVGLTTAEVIQCQEAYYYDTYANIEAKLKEKNGG